jgi:hypothetical protein
VRALNPKRAMFEGRVVARWEEDDPDPAGWKIQRITVDDAGRTQTFVIPSPTYRHVALDDAVRVTVDPWSGRLVDLTVTHRP